MAGSRVSDAARMSASCLCEHSWEHYTAEQGQQYWVCPREHRRRSLGPHSNWGRGVPLSMVMSE